MHGCKHKRKHRHRAHLDNRSVRTTPTTRKRCMIHAVQVVNIYEKGKLFAEMVKTSVLLTELVSAEKIEECGHVELHIHVVCLCKG